MSETTISRGRPRGAKRAALQGWMSGRTEFTMRDVVHSLGWPLNDANKQLHRALTSGEVRVTGSMRVPDAKRPVSVYARSDSPSPAMPLCSVMQLWSR